MIEVKDLSFRYGSENNLDFPDFSVGRGEACLLLGNSGSGKTTLLHLIGGLMRASTGSVIVNSQDLTTLPADALDKFRAANIGFVFQRNHLISSLTVRQNLMMTPWLAGYTQDSNRIDAVLDALGVLELADKPVHRISHGQAQRVAIARALVNKPAVILADEPTSALDDLNCDRVIGMLLEASRRNNSTLLVATHDQRLKSLIEKQVSVTKG